MPPYAIDVVRLVDVDGNQLGILSNLLKVGMRLIDANGDPVGLVNDGMPVYLVAGSNLIGKVDLNALGSNISSNSGKQLKVTMFDFDQQFKSDGAYVGRWTFAKDLSNGGFSLDAGDKFSIIIQDNISALDFMSFRIKGLQETA